DKYERLDLARFGAIKKVHKLIAIFISEEGIMQIDSGDSRYGSEHNVFDARLRGCGHRNGIAITTQTCCDPKHIKLFDWLRSFAVALRVNHCVHRVSASF